MDLCLLYDLLPPPRPSAPSTALCPLYSLLPPLQPSNPLQPSIPLWPSTLLWPLPLYGSLAPLWPFIPSMVICLLYGPLAPLRDMFFFLTFRKMMMLFRCFAKHAWTKRGHFAKQRNKRNKRNKRNNPFVPRKSETCFAKYFAADGKNGKSLAETPVCIAPSKAGMASSKT